MRSILKIAALIVLGLSTGACSRGFAMNGGPDEAPRGPYAVSGYSQTNYRPAPVRSYGFQMAYPSRASRTPRCKDPNQEFSSKWGKCISKQMQDIELTPGEVEQFNNCVTPVETRVVWKNGRLFKQQRCQYRLKG